MRRLAAVFIAALAFFACTQPIAPAKFDGPRGRGGADGGGPSGTFDPNGNGTPGATCAPDPANLEIPGNNCDDDGDGQVDNVEACDANLGVDADAQAMAKAIGVCKGLVSATYKRGVAGAGALGAMQHGILPRFWSAIRPREGQSLAVLSTGWAREYNGPGNDMFKGRQPAQTGLCAGCLPPEFPKSAAGCPSQVGAEVYDVAVLEVVLDVPRNAKGLAFDFNFYSGEWPEYVCSEYNDAFIALLDGKNISFDAQNNPVSVNNGFFDRCTPNAKTGCAGAVQKTAACPGGTGELDGTGFSQLGPWCDGTATSGGATGWLSSQSPVTPGSKITLQFVIYDVADPYLDSSVLIDNFRWIAEETTTTTTTRPPPK